MWMCIAYACGIVGLSVSRLSMETSPEYSAVVEGEITAVQSSPYCS